MNCSVFIATSVDGFIARDDGNIDWLESSGNQDAEMGDNADMGFNDFIDTVDCIVMGQYDGGNCKLQSNTRAMAL